MIDKYSTTWKKNTNEVAGEVESVTPEARKRAALPLSCS